MINKTTKGIFWETFFELLVEFVFGILNIIFKPVRKIFGEDEENEKED